MHTILALTCLVTAFVVQPAHAVQPANEDVHQQVDQLVKQLNDRERPKREEAEKALVALGAPALEFLPQPNNSMPAEVRERLSRVRGALEKVASSSVLQGTVVTLMGEMPLDQAMKDLEKQTGNQIVGFEDRATTIKASLDKVPYWQALDQILDQAALGIDAFGGRPNTLVLTARAPEEVARVDTASYSGAFRVDAQRLQSTRDLKNPMLQGMKVSVNVAWEPRLSPISINQVFTAMQAVDDRGSTIAVDAARGVREIAIQPGMAAVEFEIPFSLPERGATKIASLKGELTALVPGRVETFEFADLMKIKAKEMRRGGVTVILEDTRKNQDLYQLRLRVRFDEPSNALESHRGWIYNNEAYLVDANGERIENAGFETTRQEKNEVGLAYLFDPGGSIEKCKFIYKTPAIINSTTIPYELKDLMLP